MYSDLYRTVFVHIPKTAGQSIEHVFLGKHGLSWNERGPLLLRARRRRRGDGPERLAHLYAREYVAHGYLSQETFGSCFRFTTVRNPYERALSAFRYLQGSRNFDHRRFARLIERSDAKRYFIPQSEFVVGENGDMLVDFVIRFEALQEGFNEVAERVFGEKMPLPRINQSHAAIGPEVLDSALSAAVYRRYERDFDLFKYPSKLS